MTRAAGTQPPADRSAGTAARSVNPPTAELTGTARALLEAFISISSELDTRSVLQRIVSSACELTQAYYGALGILGHDGRLTDLVTAGIDSRVVPMVQRLITENALLEVTAMGTEVVRIDELDRIVPPITFPNGRTLHSLLMAPIRVRGTPFGQLYLSRKRGEGAFDQHDELLVKSLASVAGFVIENARAYGISERRRRWLEKFGELTELLMPPIDLGQALERISEALLEVSEAHSASVVHVPENGPAYAAAVCGRPLELTDEEKPRLGSAVHEVVASGDVMELVLREDWVVVLAPLRAHLTIPGVLVLTHPRLGRPDALEERELLASFADQAALAIDRTQALADRQEMAVVADRDRIARDLHDVVIQRLFATGLHMQSVRAAAPTDELRERIDQSVKDLDQTIRDIRSTIFELQKRPRSSVRTDVRDVVREVAPQLGFAPSVQTTGPVDTPIDSQLQQQLVSVLREALTNVARHAQASSASVELQVTDTHLRLKVCDDGVGIPEERPEFGLRNARRRALLLGGALDLWPNDPTGTMFVWSVPLPQDTMSGSPSA